jgi:transcriptional regulator GlxA family with amidase domain
MMRLGLWGTMANTNIEENNSSDHRADPAQASDGPGARQHDARSTERGLRATRTASIIAEIHNGFSDQQFSTRALAGKLGLSVRYVQDLVKDSGRSITERILELRLQKAHAMLTNDLSCKLKISDVAASCGFNELSHFHRCFRRRFGATPAQLRADAMTRRANRE